MSIEAMKQALEAIANSGDFLFNWHDCEPNNEREMSRCQEVLAMNEKAFTALRTAIEQAEKQEPVASHQGPNELWLQLHGDCSDDELEQPVDYTDDSVTWCWHQIHDSDVRYVRADLATPPAAPVQEPPDDELTQALIERDETEAIADELAQAISQITGVDIGEHTSANCPWRSALDAAEDFLCHPPAAQRQWVGLTQSEAFNMPLAHHWLTSKTLRDAYKLGALDAEAKLREKNTGETK